MGSDSSVYDDESTTGCSTPPKLLLFSLPMKADSFEQHPGLLTPPLQTPASIPFQWEEAPGKPLATTTAVATSRSLSKSMAAASSKRCLDLPPCRLLVERKISNMPSPSTVLDGPYVSQHHHRHQCRSVSQMPTLLSSGKAGSSSYFGSWRWGSFREARNVNVRASSSDLSSSFRNDDPETERDSKTKIGNSSIKRKNSFLNFSSTSSSLWASISGGLKQAVVPWRRRRDKLRKTSMSSIN